MKLFSSLMMSQAAADPDDQVHRVWFEEQAERGLDYNTMKSNCAARGAAIDNTVGFPAFFRNQAEYDNYISSVSYASFYLGYEQQNGDNNQWLNADGTEVTFTDWDVNGSQPDRDIDACVLSNYLDSNKWHDIECENNFTPNARYACRFETTKTTGLKNWGIDFSFRCKDRNNDPEEEILSIGDTIRMLRPANEYSYRIIMSKMSGNTYVAEELFNRWPGHNHINDATTMNPFYESYICQGKNNRWMNVRFQQKYCPESGLYTKSFYLGCLERMRYTDTVPTVLDNPEISFGGQGSLPVEGKPIVRWFNVEELQDGCGVFPNDIEPTGCVKYQQSYAYGEAHWQGETGASDVCFCYPDGKYRCKKSTLGGKSCWNID